MPVIGQRIYPPHSVQGWILPISAQPSHWRLPLNGSLCWVLRRRGGPTTAAELLSHLWWKDETCVLRGPSEPGSRHTLVLHLLLCGGSSRSQTLNYILPTTNFTTAYFFLEHFHAELLLSRDNFHSRMCFWLIFDIVWIQQKLNTKINKKLPFSCLEFLNSSSC